MTINASLEEARYILDLVASDAAKGFGKMDAKISLLKKLESTIKYHEAKPKRGEVVE